MSETTPIRSEEEGHTPSNTTKFNTDYLKSLDGGITLAQMVTSVLAFALVFAWNQTLNGSFYNYSSLPNASWMKFFLFISVFAFLYSSLMSIVKTLRITERMQIDWNATEGILCGAITLLYLIADGLAAGSIALGQQSNVKTYKGKLNFSQLQVAVAFGFFTAFLFAAQAILAGRRFYQDRKFRKQYTETPQEEEGE